ncbi:YidH family protein [Nocardioides pantholopis]|uniref:YidH family protein n=1 Tax=Nocardioides pantholopis TaxID=2483798 RepID=UPI000F0967D3|nr:DUF202 domain-containing protein [Nocardioides pantholopis]
MTVDYRFLLANERTFLAYTRTALALDVTGLGVLGLPSDVPQLVRIWLGALLVAVGAWVSLTGWLRWRQNNRAIRGNEEMEAPRALGPLAIALVLISGFGALGIIVGQ